MPEIRELQSARIKGTVVLSRNPDLYPHLDKVAEALAGFMKRNALQDVRQRDGGWILFAGRKWSLRRLFNQRNRDLADIVDAGGVRVARRGSEIIAEYYLRVLKGLLADLATLAAWFLMIVLWFPAVGRGVPVEVTLLLLVFVLAAGFMLAERFIRGHWFMKHRLPAAVGAAENRIALRAKAHDTSGVEPEHRDQGPADLLRTARFYGENNFPDKARAYLAYLVEKYPWTDEANAAVTELDGGR